MFGFFKRGSRGGDAKPSLNAVRFDTTRFADQGEPRSGMHVWHTPEGDGLGVHFFPVPPDLPPNAKSVDELAAFYGSMVEKVGGKLIETDAMTVGGCRAIRTILAVPQQPSGRACIGSITVPFRDFSFVVKCQCEEAGPTGWKEAILFERSRAAKEPIEIEGGRFHIPGFNPYDERYDAEFPDHPVARARRLMTHITGSLTITKEVAELPAFPLP